MLWLGNCWHHLPPSSTVSWPLLTLTREIRPSTTQPWSVAPGGRRAVVGPARQVVPGVGHVDVRAARGSRGRRRARSARGPSSRATAARTSATVSGVVSPSAGVALDDAALLGDEHRPVRREPHRHRAASARRTRRSPRTRPGSPAQPPRAAPPTARTGVGDRGRCALRGPSAPRTTAQATRRRRGCTTAESSQRVRRAVARTSAEWSANCARRAPMVVGRAQAHPPACGDPPRRWSSPSPRCSSPSAGPAQAAKLIDGKKIRKSSIAEQAGQGRLAASTRDLSSVPRCAC